MSVRFMSVIGGLAAVAVLTIGVLVSSRLEQVEERLKKQQQALQGLTTAMKALETCGQIARPHSIPQRRRKSPTERERPKGPMPKSLLVESKRLKSDPPVGADVTSRTHQRRPKPSKCVRPCDELAACSLKGLCPHIDTRKEDQVTSVCFDACQANSELKTRLFSTTDCDDFVTLARARITGFSELCGPPGENAQ